MDTVTDTVNEVILDLEAAVTTCAVISEFYNQADSGKLFLTMQHVIEAAVEKLRAVT